VLRLALRRFSFLCAERSSRLQAPSQGCLLSTVVALEQLEGKEAGGHASTEGTWSNDLSVVRSSLRQPKLGRSTPESMPLVTVLVNTYNHERFIAQALTSVLEQDFPANDVQTIVVDDGSTDSTSEIVSRFTPIMHYIRKPNAGQVSAFHAGIAEASGQIIAFLDGDDWWAHDKLTRVVGAFERYSDIAAVGHGYFEVDENGSLRSVMAPETECRLDFATADSAQFAANLRVFGGTSRMAIRRSALDRTLPVPAELPFFDNFIFTQGIAISGAILLPQPLCYYRIHSGNLYASGSADETRLRRRYVLQRGLVESLPDRLIGLGVPREIVSTALACDRVDTERLRLILEGGKPWNTFRVERADFHMAYRNPSLGYTFFKYFVLLLTLLMPPKTFYRIKRWYAEHNLRRIRSWIGSTGSVPHGIHQRKL
jgi:glycosyltransferase involved in cell wall biosynthesis